MRLLLTFTLKKPELITDYRRIFLSFFKKSLEGPRDGIYLEKYYTDTMEKDFTWSLQLKKPIFHKDIIELESKEIRLVFSSEEQSNTGYIFFLAMSAMKNKEFLLPNQNSMRLVDIRQLKEEKITGNLCVFKTMPGSPIAVRKHNKENNSDCYYTIEDQSYNNELTEAVRRQLVKNTDFSGACINKVTVECIQGKKVVVRNYSQYIDTTAGTFVIKGDAPLLKYLSDVGIASRKSLGFGSIELVSQLDDC